MVKKQVAGLQFGGGGKYWDPVPADNSRCRQRKNTAHLNYSRKQNKRGGAFLLDGNDDPPPTPDRRLSAKLPREKKPRQEQQEDGSWIWKEILLVGPVAFWAQHPVTKSFEAKAATREQLNGQQVPPPPPIHLISPSVCFTARHCGGQAGTGAVGK